jgi:hypothetical protein
MTFVITGEKHLMTVHLDLDLLRRDEVEGELRRLLESPLDRDLRLKMNKVT